MYRVQQEQQDKLIWDWLYSSRTKSAEELSNRNTCLYPTQLRIQDFWQGGPSTISLTNPARVAQWLERSLAKTQVMVSNPGNLTCAGKSVSGTVLVTSWSSRVRHVYHQGWISGNIHYICLHNVNKAVHSDLETHRRRHQKSKTEVPVAPLPPSSTRHPHPPPHPPHPTPPQEPRLNESC